MQEVRTGNESERKLLPQLRGKDGRRGRIKGIMQCKRCNSKIKYYSYLTKEYGCTNGIRFMQIVKGSQISLRPIPLCKDCIAELEKWLYGNGGDKNV